MKDLKAEVTGLVWKILATPGQTLEAGEVVMILESMKMEIPVMAEDGGELVEVCVTETDAVAEGQVLARIKL